MTMQFELVTPEASEAQIEATMVVVPGAEGDMGVLENHAPTVTSLRPGVVSVTGSDGNTGFFVAGGFAEITAERKAKGIPYHPEVIVWFHRCARSAERSALAATAPSAGCCPAAADPLTCSSLQIR